ncbi:MAG: hypothetical protein R3C44_07735 [Chloroflexota bacterium]
MPSKRSDLPSGGDFFDFGVIDLDGGQQEEFACTVSQVDAPVAFEVARYRND